MPISNPPSTATFLTASAPTNHGVLLGQGTQAVSATAAGTAGQVFVSNGASANAAFKSAVTCAAFNNAAQSVPDNAFTVVTFNTNDFDTNSIHSTSVNTGRFTAPVTGFYLAFSSLQFAGSAAQQYVMQCRVNGTTVINGGGTSTLGSAGINESVFYVAAISLTANDYIEFMAFQNSGGNLNILGAASPTQYNARGSITLIR